MKKIRILQVDDWIGLYIDGELVEEGHNIFPEQMIKLILPKIDIKSVWHDEEDLASFGGRCPQKWTKELENYNERE